MVKEAFKGFEKPSIAIDTVILRTKDTNKGCRQLQVLLVRKNDEVEWHLPGTILRLGETSKDAIKRIGDGKVDISKVAFEQLYSVVDDPERDDRGHVISIVYIGMVNDPTIDDIQKNDEYDAQWFWITRKNREENNCRKFINQETMQAVPFLKYDHHKIIDDTIERLKGKLMYAYVGFDFIGDRFAIRDLENTFEAINEEPIPGFRRLISSKIDGTGEFEKGTYYRPAEIYVRKK